MRVIDLNEYLDDRNVWTARLLGITEFRKTRDLEQVRNEYDLDKYSRLLAEKCDTIEDYKVLEFAQAGMSLNDDTAISIKDTIAQCPLRTARILFYDLVKQRLQKYSSSSICELGCGYGFNLSYLPGTTYGGEYSPNAVKLAVRLGRDVTSFNYYEDESYNLIRPNSTVITVHSVEQLPDATSVLNGLASQRDKVRFVVHFEPTVIPERKNLLGIARNRYMTLNDYNRNLLQLLRSSEDVEILEFDQDVIGMNPLNSTNVIAWRFRQ